MTVRAGAPWRIGYVGQLDLGGTCYSRLVALRTVEGAVSTLDVHEVCRTLSRSRWQRLLANLPGGGPAGRALNRGVVEFALEKKLEVLWVDKGDWMWPQTLARLRNLGVVLVHHLTDALWPRHRKLWVSRWRLRAGVGGYHYYLTSHDRELARVQAGTPGRVLATQLGYDDARFSPLPTLSAEEQQRWGCDCIFIGHREPRTQENLAALLRSGVPVKVFGAGWEALGKANSLWRGHAFGPVGDAEYVLRLKAAKIGLCFVSEWNHNETAGRSYEIPACGTLLLAMRTGTHVRHFREGVEAEFFGDSGELVTKAQACLADEGRRRQVAACGEARCRSSGYSWREIMLRDWAAVSAEIDRRSQIRR